MNIENFRKSFEGRNEKKKINNNKKSRFSILFGQIVHPSSIKLYSGFLSFSEKFWNFLSLLRKSFDFHEAKKPVVFLVGQFLKKFYIKVLRGPENNLRGGGHITVHSATWGKRICHNVLLRARQILLCADEPFSDGCIYLKNYPTSSMFALYIRQIA